jgi:5-formyltetrahydrofolate cyclo-ligase
MARAMESPKQIKKQIRKRLLAARLEHAASLDESTRGLLFRRPPQAVVEMIPHDAVIGLYRADPGEAPASGYARFFLEAGHTIALPWLTGLDAPMRFRVHTDPFAETDLEEGFFGLMQPAESATEVTPDVLIMPLVAFTEDGDRIGQGGGFYDKWLGAHPDTIRIGLAWDIQLVDEMPVEPHDMRLTAIVTPTRLYGPFA